MSLVILVLEPFAARLGGVKGALFVCYSAQIWAEYRKYERAFGAGLSISDYVKLFWERRRTGDWQKIPKAIPYYEHRMAA